ncbi:isocitrate lyase/phosphoenolpyruvate mutase family protein [Micromonospora sp. PLK6-60]|uniref:isocitrate lyase/PEP mutase family protein n=1 Tax=Micromonospora sp. PLK6-60 TaxID=2873383 RepID=UPI001CA6883A|nr:isocitrate lyase/phosphoenolpyruvate mutase family protein [Micromonospora sp. PLK6-60]MBY8873426.1 isocitrate lyase/phosphoenolpyruvate mutase family protein [Micromonospora sp. PLK6-60]
MTPTDRAATLRALHRPGAPLILPNAWDAGSARAVVRAGFPAVATSSGAVAESLGHADGEATPVAAMLDAVARVAAAVEVPVTADIERGYGLGPAELAERLRAAGAVGCNIEDSDPRTHELVDVDEQADLIAALRSAAGADLVINARVDVFLRGGGDPGAGFDEAVRRARRYRSAGADCVYPIVLADPPLIGRFVAAVDGPVNVMARRGVPAPGELAKLGVARVSYGSGVYAAAQAATDRMLAAVRDGRDPFAPTSG